MSIKGIHPLHSLKGHQAAVLTVEYAKNSFLGQDLLASGSEDSTCRIWDLKSKKVLKGIKNLDAPVTSIKFARKNQPYIYLSSGNKVLIYDLRSEGIIITEPIQVYEFSNDEINSIDINENNKFLATADDEGVVNIVDLSNHKIYKKTSKKHSSICMSAKFRAKKSWEVWSGGMDSKVYEWDFSRGLPTNIYDMTPKEPSATQMFNPPFVYKIATSPDGEWVAASLGDSTIQLLAPPNKKQKKHLREIRLENGHNSMVNCLSFLTSDESLLISGAANGRVTMWDYKNQEAPLVGMLQLDDGLGKLNSLKAFDMDGALYIATAGTSKSNDGALHIYQLQ
ncbi:Glutathione gamma-glutamylcysteinyltransferase [Mucor velutinosus]|uniref:Glutathione gamma-glutamylcysteinyltransferase n=1 Tax=Mucor velutinosus TaxID=708070 RepID=A0AAN7DS14_9FUNG|nr:Glutathione gamma-glutamylcysteinyltransferase [Mucor velutinosus]